MKVTPIEDYEFNRVIQIFDVPEVDDNGYITVYDYDTYVTIAIRDLDNDLAVIDFSPEQARAIGTMLLYAAQKAEAENAETEDTE